MTDMHQEHPGRDHELIERFVLDRLPPDEARVIETHVQGCHSCRSAVQAEQALVAGIRHAGRHALKSRLRQYIKEDHRLRIPWSAVVSAAAVVGIVTLVGIENNWFTARVEQAVVEAPAPPRESEAPPAKPRPETRSRVAPQEQPRTIIGESKSSDLAARKDEMIVAESAGAKKSEGFIPQQAPMAATTENRVEQVQQVAARQEAWVEGVVLDAESPRSTDVNEVSKEKNLRAIDDSVDRLARPMPTRKGVRHPTVTLSQEPFRDLSLEQQRAQQYRLRSIQTRVEMTSGGIHMTLFPESPIDSTALAQAKVESITGDSLVITLQGERIGYRLPAGWQSTRK